MLAGFFAAKSGVSRVNILRKSGRPLVFRAVNGETTRSFASAGAIPHTQDFDAGNSTVNVDEIAHFSRLSSLWWDEHGEFAQLHRMNPIRMQFLREKVVCKHTLVLYLLCFFWYVRMYSVLWSCTTEEIASLPSRLILARQKSRLKTIWTRPSANLAFYKVLTFSMLVAEAVC